MLKSGIYDFIIYCGGTDMCFVLGFGRKRPDLKQYRISGLTPVPPSRRSSLQRVNWVTKHRYVRLVFLLALTFSIYSTVCLPSMFSLAIFPLDKFSLYLSLKVSFPSF